MQCKKWLSLQTWLNFTRPFHRMVFAWHLLLEFQDSWCYTDSLAQSLRIVHTPSRVKAEHLICCWECGILIYAKKVPIRAAFNKTSVCWAWNEVASETTYHICFCLLLRWLSVFCVTPVQGDPYFWNLCVSLQTSPMNLLLWFFYVSLHHVSDCHGYDHTLSPMEWPQGHWYKNRDKKKVE